RATASCSPHSWARTTRALASRWALDKPASLAGPLEIGNAAAADFRMRGIRADVRTLVPATHALLGFARARHDPSIVRIALLCRFRRDRTLARRKRARFRSDEQEPELAAERAHLLEQRRLAVEIDLRIERSADCAADAQLLEHTGDRTAQLEQTIP